MPAVVEKCTQEVYSPPLVPFNEKAKTGLFVASKVTQQVRLET